MFTDHIGLLAKDPKKRMNIVEIRHQPYVDKIQRKYVILLLISLVLNLEN